MQILRTTHRRPKHTVDGDGRAVLAGHTLLASAALVKKDHVRATMGRTGMGWQQAAWEYYDDVPELRFGVTWAANACSRARLYVGRIDEDGSSEPEPVNDKTYQGANLGRLLAPLAELFDGQSGQAEMLRRLAVHLNVPGESYLCGWDDPDTGERRWTLASNDEITPSQGGNVRVMLPDVPDSIDLDPAVSTVIRMWRPHARRAYDPDSPVIALRGTLRELMDLSGHVAATAESRLAGAGVMFVPKEISFPTPQATEGVNPLHADPFTAALIESMVTPIKDRDSAAAVVPLVVRAEAEYCDKVKHYTFSTPFDAAAKDLRDAAIRRLAAGMDMPPEVLMGLGDSNHWSAWQVEESAVKLHIEPLLGLMADALTQQYYRPALVALGMTQADADRYVIWYDTTDLTLRPNRGPEALQAYENGLVAEHVVRRELGFSDEDAPTPVERARLLAEKVALTNGELAPGLLPLLGVHAPSLPEPANPAPAREVPDPARTPVKAPNRPELPTRDTAPVPPATTAPEDITAAGVDYRLAVAEMAALRALARSGQFLLNQNSRSYRGALKDVPKHELHVHLPKTGNETQMYADAYTELSAAVDDPQMKEFVSDYVQSLLVDRSPHSRDLLRLRMGVWRWKTHA